MLKCLILVPLFADINCIILLHVPVNNWKKFPYGAQVGSVLLYLFKTAILALLVIHLLNDL